MQNNHSLLINTCDNFEDCWIPFFKLFSVYWPDYKGKIYLNTEYKDFSYPGLNIVCTKVCEVNNVPRTKRATWSQCLKWALEQIDTEIVLYMQEDYFLKDRVKNDIVEKFVSLMYENISIDCIHLTDQSVDFKKEIIYEDIFPVSHNYKYIVSCQAALWRKTELNKIIRPFENAWQFEEFGSERAKTLKVNYFVIDKSKFKLNKSEIIPYIFTGIIQGKWKPEVVNIFELNKIVIDFYKRGFFENKQKKKLINKITYQIFRLNIKFKNITHRV